MFRILFFLSLSILATSCANQHGRVVTTERLSRLEGGGSLSTVWYYGSDDSFHYFRHLWKSSTPYRLRKDDFRWDQDFAFTGYGQGRLIKHEFSEHRLESNGITIEDGAHFSEVLQILEAKGGKDDSELWQVDRFQDSIRIRKKRTDDKVLPTGAAVEFWRRDEEGNWSQALTA